MGFISKTSTFLLCCLFICARYVTCKHLTSNIFSRIEEKSSAGHTNISDIRRSKIECAISCDQSGNCTTFSYDKQSKTCYRSNGYISKTGSRIYKSGNKNMTAETTTQTISTDKTTAAGTTTIDLAALCSPGGYTFYPTENICIKHYSRELDQVENEAECLTDGAHLLVIRDAAMHSFIKLWLEDLKSGDVHIAGEDPDGNKEFTLNGDPLPYTLWGDNEPDSGEKCMRLESSSFDFSSDPCTGKQRSCICEKSIP